VRFTDLTNFTSRLTDGGARRKESKMIDKKRSGPIVMLSVTTAVVVSSLTISAGNGFCQGSWTEVVPMSTPRRAAASTAAKCPTSDGICIYAIGGYAAENQVLDSVEAYDPATDTWTPVSNMPTARYGLAAATGPDGRIYAIGGYNGEYLNVVEAYDPTTNCWTLRQPMNTARRASAAATGSDGFIYALGGYNGDTPSLETVEVYDPNGDAWTFVSSMNTARFAVAAAIGPDGLIYAIGGNAGGSETLNTVEAYDPAFNIWTAVAAMATVRGGPAASVGPDGLIYAIGGRISTTEYLDTVEAYSPFDPDAGWSPVAPMPTARYSLAAATGPDGRIYALGGFDGTSFLDTIEAYTLGEGVFRGTNITGVSCPLDSGDPY
jgi:N-acetylneuraminic acid mutarotase